MKDDCILNAPTTISHPSHKLIDGPLNPCYAEKMEPDPLSPKLIYARRKRIVKFKPNQRKLRELILYISLGSETDERFGKTKLYKLLFYSDFLAYLRLGKPITAVEYIALPNGPAPSNIEELLAQMKKEEQLHLREYNYYGHKQFKPLALRNPDLTVISSRERKLVDELMDKNWEKNAKDVSDLSHKFDGWKLARYSTDRRTIPYNMALIGNRQPTAAEVAHGRSLEALALACLARHAS